MKLCSFYLTQCLISAVILTRRIKCFIAIHYLFEVDTLVSQFWKTSQTFEASAGQHRGCTNSCRSFCDELQRSQLSLWLSRRCSRVDHNRRVSRGSSTVLT